MKSSILYILSFLFILVLLLSCNRNSQETVHIRTVVDTIGFAHLDWQIDSIVDRLERVQDEHIAYTHFTDIPKVIISPHDDYAYVGKLYPETFKNLHANTIILFGVAHKARIFNLEDQLVFGSFDYWQGPYGNVKVSDLRDEIIEQLPEGFCQVNDSMQQIEHSLEALIPWLQYYNRNVEIIPILVPYMSFNRMMELAKPLSKAIKKASDDKGLYWGDDFAIVISSDAVHYGDEDWGGMNFATYGTDSTGYKKALAHEYEIMHSISGELHPDKVKDFCNYTIEESDHKQYKWTWCGRYSIPMGLLTSISLNEELSKTPLRGSIIGYSNSIDHPELNVDDLGMGKTAPANMRHWVGYAAIGYK